MKPNWDEAPAGATHYGVDHGGKTTWYKDVDDRGYRFFSVLTEKWHYLLGEPCCQPLIPRPTEWRGDGLPPVGTECEVRVGHPYDNEWYPCTIVGHDGNRAVFRAHSGSGRPFSFLYDSRLSSHFRPIQSDRDKALAEMWNIMNDNADYGLGGMAGALYDSGWRKRMSRIDAATHLMDGTNLDGADMESALNALGYKE